jgi:hypothetical protein
MPEHRYRRVLVMYSDGETSGNRVFKDRAKAETFAARQKGVTSNQVVSGQILLSSKRGVGSDIWWDSE